MSEELTKAIVEIKRDEALDMVKRRAEAGEDPLHILDVRSQKHGTPEPECFSEVIPPLRGVSQK